LLRRNSSFINHFCVGKTNKFYQHDQIFLLKNLNRFSRLNYLLLPPQQLSLFGIAKVEKLL
ncbi:hypothetical protein, partial [Elizabethkingia anophelis]|uniref:hypothetical protein n=1 Tax=Elizabethkingia anophelis TaxID=1117645 RepID=UPI001C875AE7